MPVFLQLRLWLKQGPPRERALAAVAAALMVVLLVAASMPLTDDDEPAVAVGVTTGGTTATSAGSTSGAGESAAPGAGAIGSADDPPAGGPATVAIRSASGDAAGPGAPAPTSGAAQDACSGLGASAPGVTANEVLIGFSVINLAGAAGNEAFDIRPDLKQVVAAMTAEINKTGGVACGRKLVAKTYDVNPIDARDQQSKCLQMAQDKVFVDLDMGGYNTPVARACFVQHGLPHQTTGGPPEAEVKNGYPYIYGTNATAERSVRNAVLELSEIGYFAPPRFVKLGLLTDACDPPVVSELEGTLARVGVKREQISKFALSCNPLAPPSEVTQAVLHHKSAGATHVFLATAIGNSQRYAQLAGQQGFTPAYSASDYGSVNSSAGTWDRSAAGAVVVTMRNGGEQAAGIRSKELNNCDRILKEHGLPGIHNDKDDGTALVVCDQMMFFRKAINNAGPNPTRVSYVEDGVGTMGEFRGAIAGLANWNRKGRTTGSDFRRTNVLEADCGCWKVRDPKLKPAA